jgi:hypothetical protein
MPKCPPAPPEYVPSTTTHRSEIDGPFVFQHGSFGHSELSVTHGARHDCSSIAARDGRQSTTAAAARRPTAMIPSAIRAVRMALYHWTPIVIYPAQVDRLKSSRDGAQALERFQPFGDPVPTDEHFAHQTFISTFARRHVAEKECGCGGSIKSISVEGDTPTFSATTCGRR